MDKTIVNHRRPFNTVPAFLISYYHFLFPLESNGLSVYIIDSFFRRIADNRKRLYTVFEHFYVLVKFIEECFSECLAN